MRRLLVVLVGALVLLVGAGAALYFNQPDPVDNRTSSRFAGASLPVVSMPIPPELPPPPKPKFTRTIWTSTKLADIDAALDRCRGPVSADLGDKKPVFVAEHDYCGGSAWMWKLGVDDAVALTGAGIDAATYVVSELRYFPRKAGATVEDLPPGDVVLQTCVSPTRMVFIALKRQDA